MADVLPASTYRLALLGRGERTAALRRGYAARLLPSDAGFFPRACGHRRSRPQGCAQLVLLVCTAGAGRVRLAGDEWALGPGEAAVLPPHRPHAYAADAADPWTIWWVHLAGSEVAPLCAGLPALAGGRLRLGDTREAVRLIARMLAMLEQGGHHRRLDQAALCAWQLLAHLGDHAAAGGEQAEDGVTRAIRHMHAHIAEPLTVAGLAQVAGWSTSHFAARFRAATGSSPLDHFLRLRMQHAAWLLDNGDDSVTEIAHRLGYEDAFYFSRRFRAIHGRSPSQWRGRRERG